MLWLLIALSVISVGVMIYRALWSGQPPIDTERFVRELKGAFERGEIERLQTKYTDDPAVPVQVGLRGLSARDKGAEAPPRRCTASASGGGGDRNLIVLGTLGNNVPFVGLFGTVLGVINAFQHLAMKAAKAEQETLLSIAEALSRDRDRPAGRDSGRDRVQLLHRKVRADGGADEVAHAVLSLVHGAGAHERRGTEAGDGGK